MQELLNTHTITPVALSFPEGKAADVAQALDKLLKARGNHFANGNKTFALSAFATATAAQEAVARPGERILVEDLPEFRNADNCVWVAVTSLKDPTLPAVLLREVFHSEEVIVPLLEACESPTFSEQLAAFNELVAPGGWGDTPLREVFTQLVLHEVQSNMRDELGHLPATEIMDLSPRGDYVREPFDVDPIDTLLEDPYALSNAAHEHNIDYIVNEESRAINTTVRDSWTNSAAEDLIPALTALGNDESTIEERLREWCQECTSHTGVLDFKLQGDCAITARPMLGKEGIYITFDGVTSSAYNAVVDADYLAMLDTLRIDVRGWVDHLATSAGLARPNWDIDLKGFVEGQLNNARHDPATGYHWDNRKLQDTLREDLLTAIFQLPAKQSREIAQEDIDALTRAHAAYRAAVKDDATPEFELARLKQAYDDAMEATRPNEKDDANRKVAEYLMDIALQPLLVDADALDGAWQTAHGVDLNALSAIKTSTEAYKTFPQLNQAPQYCMALANIGSTGSVSHDWKNPPNVAPTDAPLISNSKLTSILENANYSGNLVFAFSCDLDDLQRIGDATQGEAPKEIRVDGAYLHIHDYNNGAGDGEELDAVWTFTTDQLKDKSIVLRNDTGNGYGIQGVFGQFLAENCGIVITEPKHEPIKRLENEEAPALS